MENKDDLTPKLPDTFIWNEESNIQNWFSKLSITDLKSLENDIKLRIDEIRTEEIKEGKFLIKAHRDSKDDIHYDIKILQRNGKGYYSIAYATNFEGLLDTLKSLYRDVGAIMTTLNKAN